MAAFKEKFPDIYQNLSDLNDANKIVRKKALLRLEKDVIDSKKALRDEDKEVLEKEVFTRIVGMLRDEHERSREIAAGFLLKILKAFHDKLIDVFFAKIIETVNSKITSDDQGEPSEEVRLEMVKLISAILEEDINQAKHHRQGCLHSLGQWLCGRCSESVNLFLSFLS